MRPALHRPAVRPALHRPATPDLLLRADVQLLRAELAVLACGRLVTLSTQTTLSLAAYCRSKIVHRVRSSKRRRVHNPFAITTPFRFHAVVLSGVLFHGL